MKKVLIISPHFPPLNTADMHRVRQGLPYFREFGWEPVVITVAEEFIEVNSKDLLLLKTIPSDIEVHTVKALPVKYTRKLGLGSLSMRSYIYIKRKGDELLRKHKFDLVYFSTTAFHVMALGSRWKRKFGVPFILDIQDPWRNDFYLDKPKSERPPKFFISYNIDKYLEAKTVPNADGIISVSQGYCDTFKQRYPNLKEDQFRVIPFGASTYDFDVMQQYVHQVDKVAFDPEKINIVYIGRGGHDMRFALEVIFKAFAKGLKENNTLFSKVHFWFIGTSYAQQGMGKQTILPIAALFNVENFVTEIPDRFPYFETLYLLKQASALVVPGSTDTAYTASKIYSYILAQKLLLAVFYKNSSVVNFLQDMKVNNLVMFDHTVHTSDEYVDDCFKKLNNIIAGNNADQRALDVQAFEPYTARVKTLQQVEFFNQVVNKGLN